MSLSVVREPPPSTDVAIPPVLRTRLASFGELLHDAARFASSTEGARLRELVVEFGRIRRDVGQTLIDATGDHADVPAGQQPAATRRLPQPCEECGGPIWRPIGARGRLPKRCDACRNPPVSTHEPSLRYSRAGQFVLTLEVLAEDPIVGHTCPACPEPIRAGQHVQSTGPVVHEACNA